MTLYLFCGLITGFTVCLRANLKAFVLSAALYTGVKHYKLQRILTAEVRVLTVTGSDTGET